MNLPDPNTLSPKELDFAQKTAESEIIKRMRNEGYPDTVSFEIKNQTPKGFLICLTDSTGGKSHVKICRNGDVIHY